MGNFQWYHFILLCFVYVTFRNSKRIQNLHISPQNHDKEHITKNMMDCDRIDRFSKYLPINKKLDLHLLLLCLVPLVAFMSKINLGMIENILYIFSYYGTYKSIQYYIDPCTRLYYIFPMMIIIMLCLVKEKVIDISNLSNAYLYLIFIGILHIVSSKHHTLDIMDQFTLSHVIFYLFKL